MSAPFDFPKEYGKLGNWPGTLNANQAQALLMQALNTQKPGARFVELGFDGGRTTIALNWAASQLGASIDVVSIADPESALWFKRAAILFKMDREKVRAHEDLKPFPCDLLAINVGVPAVLPTLVDWYRIMDVGGIVVSFNPEIALGEKALSAPGVNVYVKPGQKVIDKVVDNVVRAELEKSRPGDGDIRAKVRSLRNDKKRLRDGNGADPEVHATVVADQGA